MTARIFGAAEALAQGFVSTVKPTKAEAIAEGLRLATLMAEKSPLGVQGTKRLINYSVDHNTQQGPGFLQSIKVSLPGLG